MEDSNWVKARSSIVWLAAILIAFGAVWWIERESGKELIARQAAATPGTGPVAARAELPASPDLPPVPPARVLTQQEKQWARIAWTYFERNTDATTGLAPSVEGFPASTMWDTASTLMALLAARDLEVIDQAAFDVRMAKALESLAKLPLYANALPNKSYDIQSLRMTDYRNQPTETGIGWSAIDVGRLLVPLNVIAWNHPRHTDAARRIIARWNTSQLARGGQLWGMQAGEAGVAPQATQEGRLGYEQYAARTLALMGLDVDIASDPLAHLQLVDVDGIRVPVDDRDPQKFGAQNMVVSEPWMLHGLEFGWTRRSREIAWRVYRAQEEHARKTGQPVAVSEDHVDQEPFFVYNAVFSGGKRWVAVTEKGQELPKLRSLSTKAAFGWHALLRTPYAARLVETIAPLNDPARGWFAGRYDEGGATNKAVTANTNAVVLESLAYIARGHFLQYRP